MLQQRAERKRSPQRSARGWGERSALTGPSAHGGVPNQGGLVVFFGIGWPGVVGFHFGGRI